MKKHTTSDSNTLPPPKKHFGQHFLISHHHLQKIADAVPARADDNVLEIGPGRGALTEYLQRRFSRLHCIERDRELLPVLAALPGAALSTVHQGDALDFDFSLVGYPLHVVGNLPYSVGALIIKKTLLLAADIASCTFMVQREVAERICAPSGSKTNGFLSIFCQYFGTPRILFTVPPGAFDPRPNVDSAVFQIMPDSALFNRIPRDRWKSFFAFVDKGFSQRRKKLSSLLRRQIPDVDFDNAFAVLGLDPNARAEDLDAGAWVALYCGTVGS